MNVHPLLEGGEGSDPPPHEWDHPRCGSTIHNTVHQPRENHLTIFPGLGEMNGVSHEEGEKLMAEGRDIVMAFSDYTARLSKRIQFRYYTPREIKEFMKTEDAADSE